MENFEDFSQKLFHLTPNSQPQSTSTSLGYATIEQNDK